MRLPTARAAIARAWTPARKRRAPGRPCGLRALWRRGRRRAASRLLPETRARPRRVPGTWQSPRPWQHRPPRNRGTEFGSELARDGQPVSEGYQAHGHALIVEHLAIEGADGFVIAAAIV